MSYFFLIGFCLSVLALILTLIFSFLTMRRLRENPHRVSDFEAQDLFSGADIGAAIGAVSIPKFWRDFNEKRGRAILNQKYDWVMAHTNLGQRILARIIFTLLNVGVLMMLTAAVVTSF